MIYLQVNVDYNDGDELTKLTPFTESDVELIEKVATALLSRPLLKISTGQAIHHHNWIQRGEYQAEGDDSPEVMYKGVLTEDEVLMFEERFVPMDEQCGCHTINVMKIYHVSEEADLL